jgi:Fe-S-cluster containining protein
MRRPPEDPAQATNERPDVCRACGGECCLHRPGIEAPDRFLAAPDPAGALASALASGDWVLLEHRGVPWEPGEPRDPSEADRIILYPRPATVAERASGTVFRGGESSPCVFLDPGGCRLRFEQRPRMCQSLEPSAGDDCECEWDQRAAARAWLPWQALAVEAQRAAAARRPGPAGGSPASARK